MGVYAYFLQYVEDEFTYGPEADDAFWDLAFWADSVTSRIGPDALRRLATPESPRLVAGRWTDDLLGPPRAPEWRDPQLFPLEWGEGGTER